LRAQALAALGDLEAPELADAVALATASSSPPLRRAGQRLLAALRPADAVPLLAAALEGGAVEERQSAFSILGATAGAAVDAIFERWLDRLRAGEVDDAVRLDLIEAAALRAAPSIRSKQAAVEEARADAPPIERFAEGLAGGDAAAGEAVFYDKTDVSCVRCHRIGNRGGEVGPELTQVGGRLTRPALLESIVAPGSQISQGYETVLVFTRAGAIVTGVLKEEKPDCLVVMNADGERVVVPTADILDRRSAGASAMPEDLIKLLTRRELRDLVEFLATRR
jgi:quinoprotein glucose dehydrogenase